nr:hypothetical protein [Streptomyces sp. DSM 41633]
MGISAVTWVSLVFQGILGLASIVKIAGHKLIRKAQPEWLHDTIVYVFGLVAAFLTATHRPLVPSTLSVFTVASIIVGFGLLPPLVGVIENRCRSNG